MNAQLAPIDPGPRPTFKWIDIDELCINNKYQREVSRDGEALINRIAKGFDWRRFTPVTVTLIKDKESKYFVLDGQHRILAALKIPSITDIPCWIIEAPEISEQAEAFVGLNKNRIKMMPVNIFHAEIAAGDPLAQEALRCCNDAGITVVRKHVSTLSLKENETMAAVALKNAVRKYGRTSTTTALKLIKDHLRGINLFRASTIMVVANLVALGKHTDGFDANRLGKILSKKNIDVWFEGAKSYAQNFGGSLQNAFRASLIKGYNSGIRLGKLPE